MLKAVVDTNVLISGLLGSRTNRRVIEAFRDKQFLLVTSPVLIEEFLRVSSRPHLSAYFSSRERQAIAWFLQTQTRLAIPKQRFRACRDPKDNLLLDIAVAARASIIVTGDQDLLVLHPFRRVSILTPAQFLRRLS